MEDDSECLHSLSFQGMFLLELKAKVDISWDCKEIKPANPKGNQSWIFTGRTTTEAPIIWPLDVKRQLTGKDSDAGKDWRQKEKGAAEDEMVNNITDQMNMNLSKFWEMVEDRGAWRATVHSVAKSQRWFINWITTRITKDVSLD